MEIVLLLLLVLLREEKEKQKKKALAKHLGFLVVLIQTEREEILKQGDYSGQPGQQ